MSELIEVLTKDGSYSLRSVFFQAEDGIRDPEMSRGLGDVYKRQVNDLKLFEVFTLIDPIGSPAIVDLSRIS